jgi:hypothetical protein
MASIELCFLIITRIEIFTSPLTEVSGVEIEIDDGISSATAVTAI